MAGCGRDDATQENQLYSTLSDVPPQLAHDVKSIDNIMFGPLKERCVGGIVWGECSEPNGVWGRGVQLDSTQTLYMRFSPSTLPFRPLAQGQHALVAVRLSDSLRDEVCTLTAWPIQSQPMQANGVTPQFQTMSGWSLARAIGCKGLHMLTVGLFPRHKESDFFKAPQAHADAGGQQASKKGAGIKQRKRGSTELRMPVLNVDAHNNHCVPPTTFSVRTDNTKTNYTVCAAPGHSGQVIAAEIAGISMEDPKMPVHMTIGEPQWSKVCAKLQQQVLDIAVQKGIAMQTIADATAAAQRVIGLVEGEGLLAYNANTFFKGALPDRMVQPNGMPLLLCMATRLAMCPEDYGLPRGTKDDQQAAKRFANIFTASIEPLLASATGACVYPIDLVIRAALRSGQNGFGIGTINEDQVVQNLTLLHRTGVRLLTATWGVGSLPSVPASSELSRACEPHRFHDKLAAVREKSCVDQNVRSENASRLSDGGGPLHLASTSEKRMVLARMHSEVADWLRTGTYKSRRISDANGANTVRQPMEWNVEVCVNDEMLHHWHASQQLRRELAAVGQQQYTWPQQDAPPPTSFSAAEKRALYCATFCAAAVNDAVRTVAKALHVGPNVHIDMKFGFYLAAPFEMQPCIHCDEPVHVMPGIMLSTALSKCMSCQGRRCHKCATAISSRIAQGEPSVHVCGRCNTPSTLVYVKNNSEQVHRVLAVRRRE